MGLEIAAAKIRLWREQPQVFAREVFGMEPDIWQDEVLEAFPHKPRIAMKACAGPGKTALLAVLCWNFLLTRPHPKIAATAINGDNLKDNLWAEMAKWREKSPLIKAAFQWQAERIFAYDHPETWWMSARKWSKSASPEQQGNTLRGLHDDYVMVVVDESGGIPDAVMATVENIGSSAKEWHIIQAGNPTHLEGPLYRACTTSRDMWFVVEITGDPDSPKRSSRVSLEWARDQIRTYGRDHPWVKVNVLGQFPPASINALIGPDEVREAMNRVATERDVQGATRIMGCDVGREGDDPSVICKRHGIVVPPMITLRNVDGLQGAARTSREWEAFDADACFIDNTGGFGASWIDQLRVLQRTPVGVHFAAKADDRQYYNKRTEMLLKAVQWVKEGGVLPNDDLLLGEMCAHEYYFRGDQMAVIEKDLVKAKIGRSPNNFDALALTFAYPVAPRMANGLRSAASVSMKQTYDPFARLN